MQKKLLRNQSRYVKKAIIKYMPMTCNNNITNKIDKAFMDSLLSITQNLKNRR